jgi:hypothetical protein
MFFKAESSRLPRISLRHTMPRCFKCFAHGCCHVDVVEVCSSCLDNVAEVFLVAVPICSMSFLQSDCCRSASCFCENHCQLFRYFPRHLFCHHRQQPPTCSSREKHSLSFDLLAAPIPLTPCSARPSRPQTAEACAQRARMHGEEWRAAFRRPLSTKFFFFLKWSKMNIYRANRGTKNKEQNDMTADIGFMQGMPLEAQT